MTGRPIGTGLDDLCTRAGLGRESAAAFQRLLDALAAEPDPPTTVRDPRQALDLHLADSLSALSLPVWRDGGRAADLGSGAGFPGLPLAIALPTVRMDLLESSRRKSGVAERLCAAAAAPNVRVVTARVEDWARGEGHEGYDVVTARAVAPLAVLVEYAAPLLKADGCLVAWKGARRAAEERTAEAAARLVGLSPAEVLRVAPFPGAHSRHLHSYRKIAPTPPRFPRRPGVAAKRPLP